jgi:magnesium chelatase family protein
LLDRIDIHVDVPRVEYDKLTDDGLGEPSEMIRARVKKARRTQRQRFAGSGLSCNADVGPAQVRESWRNSVTEPYGCQSSSKRFSR